MIGVLGVGGLTSLYGPEEQRYKATHRNFRDAMAAPTKLPEFKGNVANVLMETYWDAELSAAKAKDNAVKNEAKTVATETKLNPKQETELYQKLRGTKLSERERKVMDVGISNLEFHYLGSAKILGGVGKGLAEALVELNEL